MTKSLRIHFRQSWATYLIVIGLVLLTALPRLTALNQYLIVDEADRWRWAREFVYALSQGDLAATRVGDGYPGIVPVWAESIWVFIEAMRRSLTEGQWIGQPGLYKLFHEWDRTDFLFQQRLPVVLLNTAVALAIIGAVWRLFGRRVALVAGVLIALDPFYLSDSRVNRAEALITGLMTLSILLLIFFDRKRQFRYVILSGIFGGLSLLTKIQALALLPAIALVGLLVSFRPDKDNPPSSFTVALRASASVPHLLSLIKIGVVWSLAAALTWFLLWPSMWVIPLDTLTLVYNYATRKVDADGVNLFFWGQIYQDTDPGPLFYPVVFLMRVTPLALLGLVGVGSRVKSYVSRLRAEGKASPATRGSLMLLIYVLTYALLMTLGSHKQDRYLMPIFLSVDILAAVGLVYLWGWGKGKIERYLTSPFPSLFLTPLLQSALVVLLVIIQLVTVLPHHPYYYSYFNPLFGGGQTAVRTLRIGWGEGMDQVGAYLAAKPDSGKLAVSTRFTHNMLGFKGKLISLGQDDRWTQADYIVLYIQQVQRRLDPSPGFIDYFQSRQPEKMITVGDIDYAWIYPIPFSVPANPLVSVIPNQAALLGYSWETGQGETSPRLRLWWENLGLAADPDLSRDEGQQLAARLVGHQVETEWTTCAPDPKFTTQARTPGAYVESLCLPTLAGLPAGTYTVEFGLVSPPISPPLEGGVEPFLFPQAWHAACITPAGEVTNTTEAERLEAIATEAVPAAAHRLDRIYDSRIRLVAYQLDPPMPKPGETAALTLYWQPVAEVLKPVTLTVQLADSRSISLGRSDQAFYTPPPENTANPQWFPGNIIATRHEFALSPGLDGPLAAQVEISLYNDAEVALKATNLAGQPVTKMVARFTVAPPVWPTLNGMTPVEAAWPGGIVLRGYKVSPPPARRGEVMQVNLFWQADQPVTDNYVVFVHLLDEAGQLKMQHDSLPRTGAYPTPWWPPGQVVEDVHPLTWPPDLPGGVYRLVVGLYRREDGARLRLADGNDSVLIGTMRLDE